MKEVFMQKLFLLLFCAVFVLLPLGCNVGGTETTDETTASAPQTEAPDLQAKLDRNNEMRNIAGKVIMEIGGKRDVPYLRIIKELTFVGAGLYDLAENWVAPTVADFEEYERMGYLPVYTVREGDRLHLYENDMEKTSFRITVMDMKAADGSTTLDSFDSLESLYKTLPAGNYYAYTEVSFTRGVLIENKTETELREDFACFILEVQ